MTKVSVDHSEDQWYYLVKWSSVEIGQNGVNLSLRSKMPNQSE